MQEKVSFTPPEVTIFQGRPPPTSWVKENIVRFYQIQSEASFLKDLLSFVQQLQSSQLSKKRVGAGAKFQFAKVSKDGTADEIANRHSFNSMQPLIKTQIEHLEKLIKLLMKEDPSLAKTLEPELANLKSIAKAFPNLSEHELNELSEILKRLNDKASQLRLPQQARFWEAEYKMFKALMTESSQQTQNLKNELNEASTKVQALKKIKETQTELMQLLNLLKAKGQFSSQDFTKLLNLLQNLATNFSKLSPKEQKDLNALLKAMSAIKGKKGGTLTSNISSAMLQKVLAEYLSANPNATPTQIKKFLQDFLDKSGLSSTSMPFFKEIGQEMQSQLKEKITPQENYIDETTASFVVDSKTVVLDEAYKTSHEQLNQHIATNETYQKGVKESHHNLNLANDYATRGGADATRHATGGGNLPDLARHTLLDHFMPMEKEYLMRLAEVLFFDNYAAEIGNVLMDKVLDYGSANSNYGLASMLHQTTKKTTPPTYINRSQFANQLSKEKTQTANDLSKAKDTIAYLKQKIADIKDNPQLSQHQKNELIGKLQNYINNLQTVTTQLTNLSNTLDSLKIIPVGADNFQIGSKYMQWNYNLSHQEDLVINGNAKANPKGHPPSYQGGLLHTQDIIKTDQENYSDQGQNQQMYLQMNMTAYQQQTTVISTVLQLLNQMYMSVAQAIYK